MIYKHYNENYSTERGTVKMRNEEVAEVLSQIAFVIDESIVDGPTALTALKVANIIGEFTEGREESGFAKIYDKKLTNHIWKGGIKIES
jgi:hypothetical protein